MELLTAAAANEWLASRGLPTGVVRASQLSGYQLKFAAGHISNLAASRTAAVARGLAEWLCRNRCYTNLVLVAEHGIWNSCENHHLYELLLRASGYPGWSVERNPGHLFHLDQRDDLVTLLQISLIFGWGVVAADDGGYVALSIDHDGNIVFFDGDQSSADAGLAILP